MWGAIVLGGRIALPSFFLSLQMTIQETWDYCRNHPEQDMHDYAPFLREVAHGQVLEIGVCQGFSTAALLLGLDDKGAGKLSSFDVNRECGKIFSHARWTFFGMDSRMACYCPAQSVDVLFVDGDHSYDFAFGDLCRLEPLVKPGGLILAHDVAPSAEWLPRILRENWYPVEECRRAWKDFVALHPSWVSEIRPGMTGLGVITKGAN